MPKFARALCLALPLALLTACAQPDQEFESPPADPDAPAATATEPAGTEAGESASAPEPEPAGDSRWDSLDLAALPPLDELAGEPQRSIEIGRRALLQARAEMQAHEFAKVGASVDVATEALTNARREAGAQSDAGQAITAILDSFGKALPGTTAELDGIITTLTELRGPITTSAPTAVEPAAPTAGDSPADAAPADGQTAPAEPTSGQEL